MAIETVTVTTVHTTVAKSIKHISIWIVYTGYTCLPERAISLTAMLLSANVLPSSLNATHGASLATYYRCDKYTIMAQLSQNAKFHTKGKEVGRD